MRKLIFHVEQFRGAGYVAWIENPKFKGIVVQSDSVENVLKELLVSLKVKISYDYGIDIKGVDEKLLSLMQEQHSLRGDGKREIDLSLA